MEAKRTGSPDAMWNLLLLALAGTGGFLLFSGELSSTRPNAKKSWSPDPSGDVCVDARLWQDPIEAAEKHVAATSAMSSGDDRSNLIDRLERARNQNKDGSEARFVKTHRGGDHTGVALKSWIERSVAKAPHGRRVLMLAVHTRGGAWPENREFRLRTRYAIVTALSAIGYKAIDTEHIGVMDVPSWPCGPESSSADYPPDAVICRDCTTCRAIVPYERFSLLKDYEESDQHQYSSIAVLWLNDDDFGNHLYTRLAFLVGKLDALESLPPHKNDEPTPRDRPTSLISALEAGTLDLTFIGPTGSGGLVDMYKEERRLLAPETSKENSEQKPQRILETCDSGSGSDCELLAKNLSRVLGRVHVYIPWATMSEPLVERQAGAMVGAWKRDRCERSTFQPYKLGPTYSRVTGTDDVLARALVQELRLRGVRFGVGPQESSPNGNHTGADEGTSNANEEKDEKKDKEKLNRVVIITEADTGYGRTFPQQFAAAIRNRASAPPLEGMVRPVLDPFTKAQLEETLEEGNWPPELEVYRYLRGADGIIPEDGDARADPSASANATAQQDKNANGTYSSRKKRRKPIGRAQYDYIRRLAKQLKTPREGSELKAIGVCGTDLYDTLVILRALRDEFPQLLLFTTDLYSRLEHGDNLDATQNLVIASHHSLTPDLGFLFRNDRKQDWSAFTALREPSPLRDTYQTATFEACISAATGAVPTEYDLRRPYVYEIGRSGAYLLNDTTNRWNGAKFRKAWPKAVLLLAILLIPFVPAGLLVKPKLWHLVAAALLVGGFCLLVRSAMRDHRVIGGEPFLLCEGISVWPSFFLRAAAGVTAVAACVYGLRLLHTNLTKLEHRWKDSKTVVRLQPDIAPNHAIQRWADDVRKSCGRALRTMLAAGPHADAALKKAAKSIDWVWTRIVQPVLLPGAKFDPRYWDAPKSKQSLPNAIHLYEEMECAWARIARIAIMTAVYVILIGTMVKLLFPEPQPLLSRGDMTRTLSSRMMIAVVPAMLFLLFLAIDATRQCRLFITAISRQPPALRRPPKKDSELNDIKPEWEVIELIGKRTEAVNRLIILPVIVFMLMLASRSGYFDNWGMPTMLLIIVGLNFTYAFGCAISLRSAADRIRRTAIARLASRSVVAPDNVRDNINNAIERIAVYDEGAFGPLMKQPFLQAFVYPSGGIGMYGLLKYMMMQFS